MAPPIVKRYLITLDRHKVLALTSFAVIVGVSGLVAVHSSTPIPPVYQATGVLASNNPPAAFSTLGTQIQEQGKQLNEEILLSEKVVTAAAQRVKADPKEVLNKVKIRLPKPPTKDNPDPPQIIQVSYTDSDGRQAGETLLSLMQGMVQQSREINKARLTATIKALNERLPPVKQELQAAEQKLEQYNRTRGPVLLAAEDDSLVKGIVGSQQQQQQLQLQIQGVETQMRSLIGKLGLTPDQAYTSSALSADPIIQNLRAQILQNETQLEILSRDLRPEHPTIVELRKKQQAYEELLQQRASELMGGNGVAAPLPSQIRKDSNLDPARQQLANSLVSLQTQRETLIQQLGAAIKYEKELRQEYAKLPNRQLEQARLQQEVQLKRTLYDKIQAAKVDAQAAEAETVSSLSIARPPQVKAEIQPSPSIVLIVGGGVGVAFLVAGGLIFLLSALDGKVYTAEEVRSLLTQQDVPLLGQLPILPTFDLDRDEIPVLKSSHSPYAEFYERLRSNLRRMGEAPVKVLLISSAEDQEGKTVTAYNLAVASAFAGKRTLLVEADLRSPSQAKSLRVAPDPDANVEPLRYYNSKNECIRLVPDIENLYIVPSAGPQRQAAAIIESSELRRLLEDARGRFDLVVLDAPALSRCNDALLLEPYTDGMVLVARPGYTQGSMLNEAIEQLTEEEESPLLGVIINGVDQAIPLPSEPPEKVQTLLVEESEPVAETQKEDTPTKLRR